MIKKRVWKKIAKWRPQSSTFGDLGDPQNPTKSKTLDFNIIKNHLKSTKLLKSSILECVWDVPFFQGRFWEGFWRTWEGFWRILWRFGVRGPQSWLLFFLVVAALKVDSYYFCKHWTQSFERTWWEKLWLGRPIKSQWNEWMNEWMNEWNEWMNEWMKKY